MEHTEQLRWKDNSVFEVPPLDFVSNTIYEYAYKEYIKETEEGDENYLKLSVLLTENFPEHPASFTNIAYYYYNKRNWNKSLEYFEKANTAHPHNNSILHNLAENYILIGNEEKGKQCLQQIIDLGTDREYVKYAKRRLHELK